MSEERTVCYDQVRDRLVLLCRVRGNNAGHGLLRMYGAPNMPGLPAKDWLDFFNEAGRLCSDLSRPIGESYSRCTWFQPLGTPVVEEKKEESKTPFLDFLRRQREWRQVPAAIHAGDLMPVFGTPVVEEKKEAEDDVDDGGPYNGLEGEVFSVDNVLREVEEALNARMLARDETYASRVWAHTQRIKSEHAERPAPKSTAHPPIPGLSLSPDKEGASHRLGGRFGTAL